METKKTMAPASRPTAIEPFIERKDALGNVRKIFLSEWKRMFCPAYNAARRNEPAKWVEHSDATVLSFMGVCAALDALPEANDIQLAVMKGKPTLIFREQIYLKNLKRRFPEATTREGICDVNSKPKSISAPVKSDDYAWCDILDQPGGKMLIHFEAARSEWVKSAEEDSAWAKQPNHMLMVKCRKHAAMRVVPLEHPGNLKAFVQGAPEVKPLPMVDEDEYDQMKQDAEEAQMVSEPEHDSPEAAPTPVPEPETPQAGAEAPPSPSEEPEALAPDVEAEARKLEIQRVLKNWKDAKDLGTQAAIGKPPAKEAPVEQLSGWNEHAEHINRTKQAPQAPAPAEESYPEPEAEV